MGTVTIAGTVFEIYGTSAAANDYMKGHSNAAEWTIASGEVKNKALVTAGRSFDRQSWVGTVTDLATPQPLAWPRTGVVDRNGVAVPPSVIPQDVLEANWEWALALVKNGAIAEQTPGSNLKAESTREKVDVIEVESSQTFFRSTMASPGFPVARFPLAIMELLSPFLASAAGSGALAFVSGTDVPSAFSDEATDFGFDGFGMDGGANAG